MNLVNEHLMHGFCDAICHFIGINTSVFILINFLQFKHNNSLGVLIIKDNRQLL